MVQDEDFSWLDVEVREFHLPLSPFAGCHALAALMQKLDLDPVARRLRVKKLPYGLSIWSSHFCQYTSTVRLLLS
jgi:hypothetical protein